MSTPLQGTSYDKSWTDVCNTALRLIGAPRISSLTDGTNSQIACSDLLADAISEVVGGNDDWNCLRTQAILNKDSGSPPLFDYLYAYLLPADYERFISIETADTPAPIIDPSNPHPIAPLYPWKVVGNHVYTNATLVYLWYHRTVGNEDAATLPKSFLHAIHAALAASLVMPLRQDPVLLKAMEGKAAKELMQAIAVDDAGKQTKVGSQERGYTYYDENRDLGPIDPRFPIPPG
jgi:hypothetical protein